MKPSSEPSKKPSSHPSSEPYGLPSISRPNTPTRYINYEITDECWWMWVVDMIILGFILIEGLHQYPSSTNVLCIVRYNKYNVSNVNKYYL